VDPKVLRQHARDCGRLAEECADLFTREALRDLALEFWRAAESVEAALRRERLRSAGSRQRRLSSRSSRKAAPRVAHTRRRASR
jgi:hypothetical protein